MLSITIEQSYELHAIFYLGSYLLMFAYLLHAGARRKYPIYPFVLVLLCTSLFALIGGKLLSYSLMEWRDIIQDLSFPQTTNKRLYGYLIFGFLGLILSRKALHFKEEIFDLMAYAWIIRLTVARLGCLFGGCCYGIPTGNHWGIRYTDSFPAFQYHQHSGWIPVDAEYSLFVHPTQLYEVLLGITILGILHWAFKKRVFRNNLSYLMLSVILYGIARFGIEFLRIRDHLYLGLNSVQWVTVVLLTVLPLIILVLEKKQPIHELKSMSKARKNWVSLFLSVGIGIAILILIPWLSPLETVICYIILVYLAIGTLLQLIHLNAHIHHFRISSLFVLFSLVFMGQVPENTRDNPPWKDNHISVGIGGLFGSEEAMCGGSNTYQAFGAEVGYEFTDKNDYSHFISSELYRITYNEVPYLGVAPYYEFNSKLVGFGAGFNYSPYRSNYKENDLYPKLSLRLGRYDKFFFDSRFSSHLPGGLPVLQLGLGFGIGTPGDNAYKLRFGISDVGFYLNPTFNIQNNIIIDPFFAIGSTESYQVGLKLNFLIHQ